MGLLLILTGTAPDLTADLELSPLDRAAPHHLARLVK